MQLSELKTRLQSQLGDGLVTIIGSGLSCAEGLPGMGDLSTHLRATVAPQVDGEDRSQWEAICADLDTLGLEGALLKRQPSPKLEAVIMRCTAELIEPSEHSVMAQVMRGEKQLRLSRLFKHLLKPTSGIPVITTNYDRLVEFAAEQVNLGVDTMFCGTYGGGLSERDSHFSFLREVSLKNRRIYRRYQDRIKLFKPHGSLDWYLGSNGPIRHASGAPGQRLIITPGINKFRNGYESPFDLHRDRANAAIDSASRFLILGYGFHDDHLETHLRPKIKDGRPTLLLSWQLSDNARKLAEHNSKFVAIEHFDDGKSGGCTVTIESKRIDYPSVQLWDLGCFINEVLEP